MQRKARMGKSMEFEMLPWDAIFHFKYLISKMVIFKIHNDDLIYMLHADYHSQINFHINHNHNYDLCG